MLQPVNDQRLETIKNRLKAHGVRFSVSDIAKKTGFDKGNISAMLNGSKVISDNFWTKFLAAYPEKKGSGLGKAPAISEGETDKAGNNAYTQAALIVLMQRISFLLSEKTERSVVVELELIKKDVDDLIKIGGGA